MSSTRRSRSTTLLALSLSKAPSLRLSDMKSCVHVMYAYCFLRFPIFLIRNAIDGHVINSVGDSVLFIFVLSKNMAKHLNNTCHPVYIGILSMKSEWDLADSATSIFYNYTCISMGRPASTELSGILIE